MPQAITSDKKRELCDLIDGAVKGRIDANRRFIDDVLEKIQDQNHQYFLEKLGNEVRQMEIDQKAGNLQALRTIGSWQTCTSRYWKGAFASRVFYRIILRRRYKPAACFPQ